MNLPTIVFDFLEPEAGETRSDEVVGQTSLDEDIVLEMSRAPNQKIFGQLLMRSGLRAFHLNTEFVWSMQSTMRTG